MKIESVFVVLAAFVVAALATPSVLVEDEEGQQYYLTPILSRQRRAEGFGQGGANGKVQGGYAGFTNPNGTFSVTKAITNHSKIEITGSGGQVSYGHANGYGHNVGVDGRVPVWSNKSKFGESTLNVGGGVSQHFGGPGGSQTTDKKIGANFNHRW